MSSAYCPKCDTTVLVNIMAAGEQAVHVCDRCDNAMIYDSKRQFFEDELERLKRWKECATTTKDPGYTGHVFGPVNQHDKTGQCSFCGLPEWASDNPEKLLDDEALEYGEETGVIASNNE